MSLRILLTACHLLLICSASLASDEEYQYQGSTAMFDENANQIDSNLDKGPTEAATESDPALDGVKDTKLNDVSTRYHDICTKKWLIPETEFPRTKVVNSTEIVKYLESVPDADNKSECVVIMFYYPWDYYSVQVALHYNALGRYYPHLHVLAFNAYNHNGINMRFGLVGVPTILFLQNGKAIGKLSEDIRLMSIDSLAEFIWKLSGLRPSANPMVHKEDYFGPLPIRVVKQPDYALYLSWFFVIVSTLGYLISNASRLGYLTKINDWLRTTWRDANAHHEHLD